MAQVEDIYELSPLQQGMLFHTLWDQGSGVYIVQLTHEWKGELNIACFKQAWATVIQRHAILRTAFYWEEMEKPVQVVYPHVILPWREWDWQAYSKDEQEESLRRFLREDRRQGLDLTEAPVLRLTLIQLAPESYWFIVTTHHILLDGWSFPILLQEVSTCYQALLQGKTAQLPATKPFKEYILWLQQQDEEKAKSFWQKQLAGIHAPTPLGIGKSHSLTASSASSASSRYCILSHRLSLDRTRQFKDIAKQYKLTLNTMMQSIWAILLRRYSGEQEVLFGTTFAGRPEELDGIEAMVGMFINTLPMRVSTRGEESLPAFFQRIQEQQVAMSQFQYHSLVQVQQWSEIPQPLPLFQSLLVFENYPMPTSTDRKQFTQLHYGESVEQSNYPLNIIVVPDQQLVIEINYDSTRFDPTAISRMAQHLEELVRLVTENMEQTVAALSPLTEVERQQLLFSCQANKKEYPPYQGIQELVEEQAEQYPHQLALLNDHQQMTYLELHQRSNQVAHFLRGKGIREEQLVAICMEKSFDLIIAVLGVLKAGAAYVPLDPDYPEERQAYMLEDTSATMLLTQQKLASTFSFWQGDILCLDQAWEQVNKQPIENPLIPLDPHRLANVIYTSGSTGKPKGVMVEHTNVIQVVLGIRDMFQVSASSRVLFFASFAFDSAVAEIFMALCSGATLLLEQKQRILPGSDLTSFLQRHRVTHITLPPSALQVMPDAELPDLQGIISAGEACSLSLVKRWAGGRLFLNGYGPTETCICTTLAPCTSDAQHISIGRPIPNVEVYILDQYLQPVPVGVVGELYIGGCGVTRGYLHKPELTNERFLPHPFAPDSDTRVYRSGDLARYLPDGSIEYVGRSDHQVKIRGYRVELGEIEAMLIKQATIEEAVVLVQEEEDKDKRLVAFIRSVTEISMEEVRATLREQLPAFMIPSSFIHLEQFPLTPNGKVDRQQLAALALDRSRGDSYWVNTVRGDSYVAPRNPTELQLVRLMEEILAVSPISVVDNFFEIGGHSLKALQLVEAIKEQFRVQLPLATLFQHGTVSQLSERIRQENSPVNPCVVQLQAGDAAQPPLFLIHPGGGGVIGYHELAKAIGSDLPVYGIQSKGLESEEAPLETIEEMATYYVEEMQKVQQTGGYRLAGWSLGGIIAYEMASYLEGMGQEVEFLGIIDVFPFDPEEAGLSKRGTSPLREWAALLGIEEAVFANRSEEEALPLFVREAKARHLFPPSMSVESVQRMVRIMSSNTEATLRYRIGGRIGADIHLFQATEQSELRAMPFVEPHLWQKHTTGSVHSYPMPGHHDNMVKHPHVETLGKQMRGILSNQ